jgi:hypothetical protein
LIGEIDVLSHSEPWRLDPDDFIFPRTAIRLGPKFQANVPFGPEFDAASSLGTSILQL